MEQALQCSCAGEEGGRLTLRRGAICIHFAGQCVGTTDMPEPEQAALPTTSVAERIPPLLEEEFVLTKHGYLSLPAS